MKSRIGKIASSVLLLVFCLVLCLFVGCGKDNDNEPEVVTEYGINGVYYMDDADAEYLFTITGNQFLISGLNGEQKGTFTYESGALTLTFSDAADTTAASASLDGDVLKLVYNGNTYSLYKRVNYTVSFDVAGGSAVADQTVTNGKTAAKPADPAKEGYAFIGWYTDAAYTTPFAFDTTVITADTTVYARFEATNGALSEYTVTFISDTAAYDSVTTVGGVVYNLPTPVKEGYTFAGWWVSDYQSVDKPTYRYEGGKLTQNTKLFAVWTADDTPLVSVNATGASWTVSGINSDYRITVKQGDTIVGGYDNRPATGDGTYPINFSALPEGDYTVTVTKGDKSFTAYYKNKALDRVSQFRVVSSSLLVFQPVANAERYYVTILCGNPQHNHTNVDNGTSTNYNFSNCSMSADGIRFIVTAVADGYAQSVSDVYTYYLGLDAVSGVTVDNEKVTWKVVENAVGYKVEISVDGGETYESAYVSGTTSYSIVSYAPGSLIVKVTAVTDGYYSPAAEAVTFEKTTLATPAGITVDGASLTWNAVDGAVGYSVNIDGTVYTTETNTLPLTEEMLVDGKFTYGVSIMALADDAAANSAYSAVTPVQYATMGTVTYRDGNLFWAPVVGAYGYKVQVNGGSITKVAASAAGTPVTLNRSGINTLSVCFVNENGDDSAWVTIKVKAYKVELDVRGGVAVSNFYKAIGDTMALPETSRDGYDFAGWYTSPNAIANNGKQYTSAIFDGNSDIVLYAGWGAKKYTVTLNAGDGTAPAETVTVVYGEINTVPVAATTDGTKMFSGWFSEPNGAGIRYFDEDGKGTFAWNTPADITLYAYYSEVLSFDLINNGTAYSVSKGPYGIGKLTKITIPAEYNGLPVTTVEGSAFLSCATLVEVNIPNTILNVEIGTQGGYYTGSAFQGCYNLAAINVYEVDGAKDIRYWSVDGVLYHNSEFNGVEISCYPYAKGGANPLNIPEDVTTIPINVFHGTQITEVNIPYTVTTVSAKAFNYCTKLTRVTFLQAPEGTAENPLTMDSMAFYNCLKLQSIVLPARMTDFKPDTFTYCSALRSVDISGVGGNYTSKGEDGRKVLCNANGTTLIYCPKGMQGSFTIPSGVTVIGENAFADCTRLSAVTIPGFVTEIGKNAFNGCTYISSLLFEEDGMPLVIREGAFYGCAALKTLTLPSGLYKMEQYAFGSTKNLTTVKVNAKGIKVSEDAAATVDFAANAFGTNASTPVFYVTDLTIGQDVPVFDVTGVFGQALIGVDVVPGNPNYESDDGVLYGIGKTTILFYPMKRVGEFVLPDTVTTIVARVFQDRAGLTKITIGKNVTTIGDSAFQGCINLQDVVFEEGGTAALTIGNSAFRSCTLLPGIELPSRVSTIGAYAFSDCGKLSAVNVSEGLTSIGSYAFQNCTALTEITLPSTLTECDASSAAAGFHVFNGCTALATVTVTDTAEKPNHYFTSIDGILYKKTAKTTTAGEGDDAVEETTYIVTDLLLCPTYKSGSTKVTIPGTVANVWSKAFYNNSVVTEVTFEELSGDTLEFGEQAFYGCAVLTKITLPRGLTKIAKNMFYNCTSLEELLIPNTVTSIGTSAFYGCVSLTSLKFEEGGTAPLVIQSAINATYTPFFQCTKLTSIDLPERLTVIGSYAFANMSLTSLTAPQLVHITLPSTLKRIESGAFGNSPILESVTFKPGTQLEDEGDNLGIAYGAFQNCTALKTIVLPTEGSYTIGSYAFQGGGLTSIEIPACVKKLERGVFQLAKDLATVTFAEGANPTFESSVFISSGIRDITLPANMTLIPDSLFNGCANLTSIVIPAYVESIGSSAFSGCRSLTSITFATYEGADGKQYSKVAAIGKQAFQKTAISTFAFPTLEGDAVLTLGTLSGKILTGQLFASCPYLTTVTLSKSVASITDVFNGCYTIQSFVIDEENQNFSAAPGSPILLNKAGNAYRYICGQLSGEYTIPDGITEIGVNVFQNQRLLTKVVIPIGVQVIGDYAFDSCTALTEVVFEGSESSPSRLTSLGKYVFNGCTSLDKVTLPSTLTAIPDYTFQGCSSLKTIQLPDALTTIGNYSFKNAGLTSITIPAAVKTIGNSAFYGSMMEHGPLASVTFAKDAEGKRAITTIGSAAFAYQSLQSITIPASITTLKYSTFDGNHELTKVHFEEDAQLTLIDDYAFRDNIAMTTIAIPASVETIGESAFERCTALTTITFTGNKLESIYCYAFAGCTSLTSFTFPAGVTLIGDYAGSADISSEVYLFDGCTSLKTVTFEGDVTRLGGYVFTGCTALESISFPGSVVQIGDSCFEGCTGLATITFEPGTNALTLGTNAFKNTGVTALSLPDRLAKISSSAFAGCTKLADLTLGANVTEIAANAFSGCTSLTAVTFPAALVKIGNGAFNSTGLTSLTISANVTSIGDNAFGSCGNLAAISVNESNLAFTASTEGLVGVLVRVSDKAIVCVPGGFTGDIVIPEGYTLGAYALSGNPKITSVTLPDNLTTIPNYAFSGAMISEIVIPASVTKIGDGAFYGSAITSVTIPAGVTAIGLKAFMNCADLKTVTFAEGSALTKFGNYAFSKSGIESIVVPSGVTTGLGTYTFDGCTSLRSVTFEGKLTTISTCVFQGCTALTSFEIPESVTTLGVGVFKGSGLESIRVPALSRAQNSWFENCTNLKSVTFAEGTKLIGGSMFKGCTALESIEIPATITSFGSNAFQNCTALTSVTFEEGFSMANFGSYTFAGCTSLETFTVPASLTSFTRGTGSSYTFQGCTALKNVIFEEGSKFNTLNGFAFEGCTSLASITLPDTVVNLGGSAFRNSGIESFTIPAAVTTMNTYIFAGCTSLKSIVIEEGITSLPNYMFQNCTALETVVLPASLTTIGTHDFEGCTSIRRLYLPNLSIVIGDYAFAGWTNEQTLCFATADSASAGWDVNWATDCNAQLVWGYRK